MDAIKSGFKAIGARIAYPYLLGGRSGDKVILKSSGETLVCKVIYTSKFKSFKEMLEKCGISNCLPGVANVEEGINIYHSFGNYKQLEKELGVVAFSIKLPEDKTSHQEKINSTSKERSLTNAIISHRRYIW